MSNTRILREFDLNTFTPKGSSVKSKLPLLVDELKRIFSLENLEKDPSLVFSMNPDLWIPLDLIAHLEPIISITKDKRLLRAALKEANLEYDAEMECVRARVEIPRTTLIIRDVDCHEGLMMILGEFDYKNIDHEGKTWLISFGNEEETIKAALTLREKGLKTAVQSTNTYVHLLTKANNFINEIADLPYFKLLNQTVNAFSGRTYTFNEVLEIFSNHKLAMPPTMKLLSGMYSVIRETPIQQLKQKCNNS
ncbi:unnamed protein product [Blepharisma stoltei]|uniref:HTH La-type RNA-binding domain-containing protein n=1 Tax=Blepharisma stoltei TaxID=1481888 RepID=A0AAU9K9C1_9CILI|nr:unnamed protein product [Blepharisma stoltei]